MRFIGLDKLTIFIWRLKKGIGRIPTGNCFLRGKIPRLANMSSAWDSGSTA